MTVANDIDQAKGLFERGERVTEPMSKVRVPREAFELLAWCAADEPSDHERPLIANLRPAHTRRLLAQLPSLTVAQLDLWLEYFTLLFGELKEDVTRLTDEDPQLHENYRAFPGLWSQELLDALRRA